MLIAFPLSRLTELLQTPAWAGCFMSSWLYPRLKLGRKLGLVGCVLL